MTDEEFTGWRKSSRSTGDTNCVEVGYAPAGHRLGVRDTKQHGRGPVLRFTGRAWQEFTAGVAHGEITR